MLHTIQSFLNSPKYARARMWILGVLGALVIFQAGMAVGYHKARFMEFGGPRGDMRFPRNFFDEGKSSHGARGTIVSINLPTLVVAGFMNDERVVTVSGKTMVRTYDGVASTSDLRVGDSVTVLGKPNDNAQIDAVFIRVMQNPYASTTPAQ